MKDIAVTCSRAAALLAGEGIIVVGSDEYHRMKNEELIEALKAREEEMIYVIKGREESEASFSIAAMNTGPIKSKNKRARREARGWK